MKDIMANTQFGGSIFVIKRWRNFINNSLYEENLIRTSYRFGFLDRVGTVSSTLASTLFLYSISPAIALAQFVSLLIWFIRSTSSVFISLPITFPTDLSIKQFSTPWQWLA